MWGHFLLDFVVGVFFFFEREKISTELVSKKEVGKLMMGKEHY